MLNCAVLFHLQPFSPVFQDCVQTSSLMALMNLVVCSRSCLELKDLTTSILNGTNALSMFPCTGGRTAEHALGMWACPTQAVDNCVWQLHQDDAGGHTVGCDHESVVERYRDLAARGAADVSSGRLMEGFAGLHIRVYPLPSTKERCLSYVAITLSFVKR